MSFQGYMTIEGTRQRKFLGDNHRRGQPWRIKVLSIQVPATVLRDAASGQASGKRQHEPIKVVKEWGASSPQILQALTSNEHLTSVVIVTNGTGGNGQQSSNRTLRLGSANIVGVRRQSGSPSTGPDKTHELEEVSFTFQKIAVEYNKGNTAATDDWGAPTDGTSNTSGSHRHLLLRRATLIRWP